MLSNQRKGKGVHPVSEWKCAIIVFSPRHDEVDSSFNQRSRVLSTIVNGFFVFTIWKIGTLELMLLSLPWQWGIIWSSESKGRSIRCNLNCHTIKACFKCIQYHHHIHHHHKHHDHHHGDDHDYRRVKVDERRAQGDRSGTHWWSSPSFDDCTSSLSSSSPMSS